MFIHSVVPGRPAPGSFIITSRLWRNSWRGNQPDPSGKQLRFGGARLFPRNREPSSSGRTVTPSAKQTGRASRCRFCQSVVRHTGLADVDRPRKSSLRSLTRSGGELGRPAKCDKTLTSGMKLNRFEREGTALEPRLPCSRGYSVGVGLIRSKHRQESPGRVAVVVCLRT